MSANMMSLASSGGKFLKLFGDRKMMKTMPTARDYVQDGLIHQWDGIENAAFDTHDINSSVWKDIKGGFDFSLDSRYGFGTNSFICKTPNTRGLAKRVSFDGFGTPTIEVCYSYSESDFVAGYLFGIQGDGFSIGMNYSTSNGKVFTRTNGVHQGYLTLGLHSASLVCTNEAMSSTKNYYYQFIDGSQNLRADYIPITSSSVSLQLMKTTTVGSSYNMCIHSVRIYNRRLSAFEIAANYAIDKARFNLPDKTI